MSDVDAGAIAHFQVEMRGVVEVGGADRANRLPEVDEVAEWRVALVQVGIH